MTTISMNTINEAQKGKLVLIHESMSLRSGRATYDIATEPARHSTNRHEGQVVAGILYRDGLSNSMGSIHVGRIKSVGKKRMTVEILPQSEIRTSEIVNVWLHEMFGVRAGQWGQHHVWVYVAV